MDFYWNKFSHASVLPKMHFLEVHMVPWVQKWKAGFGMIEEQGLSQYMFVLVHVLDIVAGLCMNAGLYEFVGHV